TRARWNRCARSAVSSRSTRASASSTWADGLMSRPCSSHVYQDSPTPASCATSSRRSPGVRRRPLSSNPTLSGETRARRSRRKSASSDRRAAEGGGASPTIDALLVPTPTVAVLHACDVDEVKRFLGGRARDAADADEVEL